MGNPDLMGVRARGQALQRRQSVTIASVMSCLPAPKASSFLYALSSFNWGEFQQGDSIDIHSIRIMVGARWKVHLGGDSSFLQGEDVHLLSVEDLRLINPPFDGSGDRGHGEDHISNLLIQSKRKLANEGELLLHSSLHREILEVGDVLLKSVIGVTILLLE